MNTPALYLLPTPLSAEHTEQITLSYNKAIIDTCTHFIVEELKTARRYLRAVDRTIDIDGKIFSVLNEHTPAQELTEIFKRLQENGNSILMSEAGCPGVADPGAVLVKMAHAKNIQVVPLIGPSSIIMAVMASGLNGQSFAFNGYLPKEKEQRTQKIRTLEKLSAQQSQWFIETPYRNMQLIEELLSVLSSQTMLCMAANITAPDEFIKTKTISDWKKALPSINKIPCVFGIGQQ